MLFAFTETWHMLHKDCIEMPYYSQHKVLLFLNESQPPLNATFVKWLFVNPPLTVIVGMDIWCIVLKERYQIQKLRYI